MSYRTIELVIKCERLRKNNHNCFRYSNISRELFKQVRELIEKEQRRPFEEINERRKENIRKEKRRKKARSKK